MNRLQLFSLAVCFLPFLSCGQQKATALRLDFFHKLPAQVDGCSGLYTYDTTSLAKEKYILATDLQQRAFININGRQIALTKTSSKELPQHLFKSTYKGGGYTVVVTTKTLKQTGDEVFLEGGTLEVSDGKHKATIKVHGESGC